MTTLAEQMIADATAAIAASPDACGSRVLIDPVRAGERDNYRSAWFTDLDLLTLSIPAEGADCRFRLIVSPSFGRMHAPQYVIAWRDDMVWEATLRDLSVRLHPAGNRRAVELASLVTAAAASAAQAAANMRAAGGQS